MTTPEPTHTEIESLLGAYALDAVSSDEAHLVEDHLEGCATCAAEVAGHRDVAASLAHSYEEPSDGLWSRISAEIEPSTELQHDLSRVVEMTDRNREPSSGDVDADGLREGRRVWPLMAAAAAVVIVALLGAVVLEQGSRIDELENIAAPTMRDLADGALSDPAARTFELVGGDGTRVSLVVEPTGRGYVFADALPELAEDRTYQLWGIADDHVVSLGLLDAEVAAFTLPAGVDTVAITEEATGGVVQPSQDPLVAGAVAN